MNEEPINAPDGHGFTRDEGVWLSTVAIRHESIVAIFSMYEVFYCEEIGSFTIDGKPALVI